MPSKHCKGIFDQVHVSAGRKHEKGRYEKYPELYLVLKLMSHILTVAARKTISINQILIRIYANAHVRVQRNMKTVVNIHQVYEQKAE